MLAQLLGMAGKRPQAVGVEDHRRADIPDHPAGKAVGTVAAAQPGAHGNGAGPRGDRVGELPGSGRPQMAVAALQRHLHLLDQVGGDHRLLAGGDAGRHVPGAGTRGRPGGQHGGPRKADRTAGHVDVAAGELVRLRPAPGHQGEHRGVFDQAGLRLLHRGSGRNADLDHANEPGGVAAGVDVEPDLVQVEGRRRVRAHVRTPGLAGRRVNSAWDVDGDHGHRCRRDRLYRLSDSSPGPAGESGAQQRVDDDRRTLEPLGREFRRSRSGQGGPLGGRIGGKLLRVAGVKNHDLAARAPQDPRRRIAVTTVVARAADDDHAPRRN